MVAMQVSNLPALTHRNALPARVAISLRRALRAGDDVSSKAWLQNAQF
jgi:hypothetical protein